ncbi:myb/SANT-like DNA-binding domain-containing protein 4 [Magallana gigas]|uniref:myb/SANT-like DNA-binding domain-containing protein 4 n=1 Tax=Magallana gigas TaxID=29159 RepID=UPI00333ED5AB
MARNSKRNPNFSGSELSILTEEVEKRKQLLFAKQSTTVCNSMKRKAWEDITKQVNAVNCSNVMHSGEDVKKKWTCMSRESKKKLALNKREQRKIGGGDLYHPKSVGKKRKRVKIGYENSTCTPVETEQQRLVVQKQRLRVEEDRLQVERKRLEIEERLNLCFEVCGSSSAVQSAIFYNEDLHMN